MTFFYKKTAYKKPRSPSNAESRQKRIDKNLEQRKNTKFKIGDLYEVTWGAVSGCIYEVTELQHKIYGDTNLRYRSYMKAEDPAPLRVKFSKVFTAQGEKCKGVKHAWPDDFGLFEKVTRKIAEQKIQTWTNAIHNWTKITEKLKGKKS